MSDIVHELYVVYDMTAQECSPVFQAINDGVARRSFLHLIEKVANWDKDSYRLLKIGNINLRTCDVVGYNDHVQVLVDYPTFDEVKNE